jgi:hypothetical protein
MVIWQANVPRYPAFDMTDTIVPFNSSSPYLNAIMTAADEKPSPPTSVINPYLERLDLGG